MQRRAGGRGGGGGGAGDGLSGKRVRCHKYWRAARTAAGQRMGSAKRAAIAGPRHTAAATQARAGGEGGERQALGSEVRGQREQR
jgi:hypothetical protein